MFFNYSIDSKETVRDPNGNWIKNLPTIPLNRKGILSSYIFKRVPSNYVMRPDLVALMELGSTDYTEYIMMFNQIGNPFSIEEDDVLLIPDSASADALMLAYDKNNNANASDKSIQDILVQNYYRYSGRQNYVDMSSYDDFLNEAIPSGNTVPTDDLPKTQRAPYLLKDDEEAMVFKDGKIYFNDKNSLGLKEKDLTSENIDKTISNILDGVVTDLSGDNCSYNGTSLSDFIKALNDNE